MVELQLGLGGIGHHLTLKDYAHPDPNLGHSSILRPAVVANNFEIKPAIIQMLAQNDFEVDIERKDPHAHLTNFLEICHTFKYNGVSDDAIRLRLFLFFLTKKAKDWLKNQPADTFTNWALLSNAFLSKFFSPEKTAQLRNNITCFVQEDDETLYKA